MHYHLKGALPAWATENVRKESFSSQSLSYMLEKESGSTLPCTNPKTLLNPTTLNKFGVRVSSEDTQLLIMTVYRLLIFVSYISIIAPMQN